MTDVRILIPEKDYLIVVPINETGEDELYRGEIFKDDYISCNVKYMLFHEDTYVYMESRLFDIINAEMDVLINMYEEVIIENDRVPQLGNLVDLLVRNSDDDAFLQFTMRFRSLIQLAMDHHTSVGFCF